MKLYQFGTHDLAYPFLNEFVVVFVFVCQRGLAKGKFWRGRWVSDMLPDVCRRVPVQNDVQVGFGTIDAGCFAKGVL